MKSGSQEVKKPRHPRDVDLPELQKRLRADGVWLKDE